MQKNKPSPPWHGKALMAALATVLAAAIWNIFFGGTAESQMAEITKPPSDRWGIYGRSKTHNVTFVVVKKEHQNDPSAYLEAGKYICGKQDRCAVAFWDFARDVPNDLPFTDVQLKSRSASYIFKTTEGASRMWWGCRFDKTQCG